MALIFWNHPDHRDAFGIRMLLEQYRKFRLLVIEHSECFGSVKYQHIDYWRKKQTRTSFFDYKLMQSAGTPKVWGKWSQGLTLNAACRSRYVQDIWTAWSINMYILFIIRLISEDMHRWEGSFKLQIPRRSMGLSYFRKMMSPAKFWWALGDRAEVNIYLWYVMCIHI